MEHVRAGGAPPPDLSEPLRWLSQARRILVFTGAGISTEFGHSRLSRPERRLEDARSPALHDRSLPRGSGRPHRALAGSAQHRARGCSAEPRPHRRDPPAAGWPRSGRRHAEHRRPPSEGRYGERDRAARHLLGGRVPRLRPADAHRHRPGPRSRGRPGSALRALRRPPQDRDHQLRPAARGGRHRRRDGGGAPLRRLPHRGIDAVGVARGCGAGRDDPRRRPARDRQRRGHRPRRDGHLRDLRPRRHRDAGAGRGAPRQRGLGLKVESELRAREARVQPKGGEFRPCRK